jgi:hypothetical protein
LPVAASTFSIRLSRPVSLGEPEAVTVNLAVERLLNCFATLA